MTVTDEHWHHCRPKSTRCASRSPPSTRLLEQTRHALEESRRENTVLRQKLDALARRFFGKKSEQLNAAQLELLLSGLAEEGVEDSEKKRSRRRGPRRRRGMPLRNGCAPRTTWKSCAKSSSRNWWPAEPEQWKRIGQEVSRQLDYQPGKFFWQETVRPKYVRVGQRATAAGHRARAGTGGRPQPGRARLAGAVAGGQVLRPSALLPAGANFPATARRVHQPANKWCNGRRRACGCCRPSADCLAKSNCAAARYVQVDETPVRYQDPAAAGPLRPRLSVDGLGTRPVCGL